MSQTALATPPDEYGAAARIALGAGGRLALGGDERRGAVVTTTGGLDVDVDVSAVTVAAAGGGGAALAAR